MKISSTLRAVTLTGAAFLMMASSASAATITYTDLAGTGFNDTSGLTLAGTNGATLTFTTNGETLGIPGPSNTNYGTFTLACANCTIQAGGTGAFFNAFTFNLKITDVTDNNATGIFVGSAASGTIFSDSSPLTITWLPAILGPGTTNAFTGDFGATTFDINTTTRIVCPNCDGGKTTVQGSVDSSVPPSAVPEPATLSLVGAALLGIGLLRRRIVSRP